MKNLKCRKCNKTTKHWYVGDVPTVKEGKKPRYKCSECGSSRYKDVEK
jgi:transposase-like protein